MNTPTPMNTPSLGCLYLMPNTLDLGTWSNDEAPPPITDALPLGALQVAASLQHWVVENAKTSRAFLKRVDAVCPLKQPLQALEMRELPRPPKGRAMAPPSVDWDVYLSPALQGQAMGLMSEAGLPAVADPGNALVDRAHARGLRVMPLSGPTSLLLALSASGLDGQSFAFVGYIPSHSDEREARLRGLEQRSRQEGQTQILIETPYRNQALLDALVRQLQPQTRLSVSMGLTLPNAWTRSAPVAQWRTSPSTLANRLPAVFCFLAQR